MASTDHSLVSNLEEQKWVVEISKILNHQLETNEKTPSVSIFRVPETISTNKPEAYEPQQIGLGPIHHFQPKPYKKMEQKKLVVMRKLLGYNNIKDYKVTILDKVQKVVPIVRSCYDMFLQDDDEQLTWIFAIDGLFLLNLLRTYDDLELHNVDPKKRSVAQDVMMVENQIPFKMLKQIDDALHSSSDNNNNDDDDDFSPSIFRNFCMIHSPLKLCSESQAPSRVDHLLHYMYQSIIKNVPAPKPISFEIPTQTRIGFGHGVLIELPQSAFNVHQFILKIPHEEIAKVYEQTVSILEAFCQFKVVIPSASDLHKAGFRFYSLEEDKGISKIHVRGKDIYLPIVTLNKDSDVILRNLVVYETLTAESDSFLLTEFMVLMCALVVNVDDVKRLGNVIKGDLDADEVVDLFTGMRCSIPAMKMSENSGMQRTVDEINKVYNSRWRMQPYLLSKKLAHWLLMILKAIGGFVGSSWKVVAFIVSIVTVVFLSLQAYCDVYGCKLK